MSDPSVYPLSPLAWVSAFIFPRFGTPTVGLKALHDAIRRPSQHGWQHLQAYLHASPSCSELCNTWEAQTTIKDQRVFPQLLLLLSDLIAAKPPPACGNSGEAGATATTSPSEISIVVAAQQLLISQALGRRLKSLYHALGSEQQPFINAALQLLTAVAGHSSAAARDLVAAFDWSLTALARVSRPPK